MARTSALLFLTICLAIALSQASGQIIRDKLGQAIKELSQRHPFPNGVVCPTCIVTKLQHNLGNRCDTISNNDLEKKLVYYPSEAAKQQVRILMFSEETKYSSIPIIPSIKPGQMQAGFYFLQGKRVNSNTVNVGVLNTVITATTVNRKLTPSEEKLAFQSMCAEAAKVLLAGLSRITV